MANPATGDYIEERKRAELAALAEGGERARQAYLDAESQANARHQASLNAELGAARSRNFDQSAQDEIARILGEPHTEALAGLGQRRGINDDYMNRLGQVEGSFYDRQRAMVPAIEAELAAAAAGRGGGGGGGGRGGGGGDGDEFDWYKALRDDAGGLQGFIPGYLQEASYGWGPKGLPMSLRSRAFAEEMYGVPRYAAEKLVPLSPYLAGGLDSLANAQAKGVSYQKFSKKARAIARSTPGNQVKGRKYLEQQARGVLPAKKKPRR